VSSAPAATDTTASREKILRELRDAERFILVTHENPDGDALGSLVAMNEILGRLGKDSLMFMAADEFPLPYEYRFFLLDGLISVPPEDVEERTIVFLDCGNIDRNPADVLKRDGAHILNIDHHHDNTHFGTVDHVVPEASCTAEIVWDLMRGLGVEPSMTIAEALYVGLVTDTGRFMYENTGTRAHVMAAELIAAGVDVHEMYRRLYEGIPFGKLELLARALSNIERYDEGRLTITRLSAQDYAETGAAENFSEVSWITCAPSTAPRSPGWSATSSGTVRRAAERSRCAPRTSASTSRRSPASRAAAATARRRASPPRWSGPS
jgi:phosphoesterase RecJ-like protein